MATVRVVQQNVRNVRPVLSVNHDEAKRRVLNLYKAWYRQIPLISMPFTALTYFESIGLN